MYATVFLVPCRGIWVYKRPKKIWNTNIVFCNHIPFCIQAGFPGGTLYISFLLLCVIHSGTNRVTKNLLAIGLLFLSLPCDWGLCAPLWVLAFDCFKEKRKQIIAFLAIGFGYAVAWSFIMKPNPYIFAFVLATPIIYMYNGRQGKSSPFVRSIFYIYYPLHLFVLGAIRLGVQVWS